MGSHGFCFYTLAVKDNIPAMSRSFYRVRLVLEKTVNATMKVKLPTADTVRSIDNNEMKRFERGVRDNWGFHQIALRTDVLDA